jgi:hypothetical protein
MLDLCFCFSAAMLILFRNFYKIVLLALKERKRFLLPNEEKNTYYENMQFAAAIS